MGMRRVLVAGLAAILSAQASASATDGSPIAKVVEMLSGMQAKVIKEGEDSQAVYKAFSEHCEDRNRELAHEIKVGNGEVESLKATIASDDATTEELKAKIENLASDIASAEAQLKEAEGVRGQELKDFRAEEKELTETIGMLERAAGILEREMAKGSPSMLQVRHATDFTEALSAMVSASVVSSADASKLSALVQTQQGDDEEDTGAPAAAVYESQSGNVVETVKNLQDKAEAQLEEIRKAETDAVHNFEMLKQSLTDQVKFANKDLEAAKKGAAAASESKAVAEGDLDATSKDLAAAVDTKGDLHHSCMSKAMDFEAETKARSEELSTLAQAKQVIKEATGGAENIVYSEASFLQTSSRTQSQTQTESVHLEHVRRVIHDLARHDGSKALSLLSDRIAAVQRSHSHDPFTKVKGLITDLIAKLEEEAGAAASKKAYCDKELKESNDKKAEKTAEVEKLTTSIDKMTATSASLKEEVVELQKALSKMAGSESEMDKIRAQEKEVYTTNSAELRQGLEGVKMALKVLSDYYGNSGSQSNASASIIGLLEVCESDFSKNLAEMETEEESAASDYEQAKKDYALELTTKKKDVEYKAKEAAKLEKDANALSADLSNVQAELDAILDYLSKIEAQCTDKAETYEERKARRTAEIEGLKSALEALSSEALVQVKSTRRVSHQLRGGFAIQA